MSRSNSPTSFLYDDKLITDHQFAMKYIKDRSEKANTIQNILAPITAQDEFIFDIQVADENASEVSELSDPFAELGGNIISSAESQQKRRLSKIEADVLVMNSFPPTHMKIQNELIREVEIPFPPQLDIDSILEGKIDDFEDENDADFFQQIKNSMEQVGIKAYNEDKKKSEDKEAIKKKSKQKKLQDDQEADSSSLMSGIWRMLDAASMDDDGFPITQPGYNFYRDKKLFVRPIEKTWTQKEEVRKKCEEWLKNLK